MTYSIRDDVVRNIEMIDSLSDDLIKNRYIILNIMKFSRIATASKAATHSTKMMVNIAESNFNIDKLKHGGMTLDFLNKCLSNDLRLHQIVLKELTSGIMREEELIQPYKRLYLCKGGGNLMNKEQLIELIQTNTNNYYNGKECISDVEFDLLIEELRQIEPNHELLKQVGWGYSLSTSPLSKHSHYTKLAGIDSKHKVSASTILPADRILTPKLDGGSVELIYVNGKLIRALTRGNGEEGLDVTSKLMYSKGVLRSLKIPYTGNIVGEYLISMEDMAEAYPDAIAQRNIPNGFLARDSVTEVECRRFTFIPYKITGMLDPVGLDKRIKVFEILKNLGFIPIPYIAGGIDNAYQDSLIKLSNINGYHYLVDGIVGSKNVIELEPVGDPTEYETIWQINYPDEIAYKSITETAVVKVTSIDWNLTRLGKLVPVLNYEGVVLSGAICHRATAFNAEFIRLNKIGIGTYIVVTRGGQVIPDVLGVYNEDGEYRDV